MVTAAVGKWKAVGVRLALGGWGVALLLTGAYLGASHDFALPTPPLADPAVGMALGALVRDEAVPAAAAPWAMVHVLYRTCGCSKRILEHLVERGAEAGVHETVLLVGDAEDRAADDSVPEARSPDARAAARGFDVRSVTPEQLKSSFHLEAAPVLAVLSPSGKLAYLGGYTDHKRAATVHDTDTLAALEGGRSVPALPLFGCAVSQELKSVADPIGLNGFVK